ncbi:MAG: hypothetical protein A2Y16_05420 [Tenericutes bacterium GWF2_57_13]|nr:MAG: hypothetical protein A2Y16_05420 [Tenericutes bacterium GWF2_57_13]
MGLLNAIFGKKNTHSTISPVDFFNPYFSGSYDPNKNITYVAVCDELARSISKCRPIVTLKGEPATSKKYIEEFLTLRPNPFMSAPVFWETMARDYYTLFNAIAWLEYDWTNFKQPLKAIWPLDVDKNSLEAAKAIDGRVYAKFSIEGVTRYVDHEDMLIISRNVKPSAFFGQISPAANQTLKVLQANYEGLEQAIKTSAFIRYLVSSPTLINEDEKKKKAKYFAETYLGKDSSGVVYVDQATNVTRVESAPRNANVDEMKSFKDEIYEYLGSNPKVTRGEANEDEWQSHYESALEPFFVKCEAELTYKLFTPGERSAGNRIEIDADRLHTASMRTRVQVAALYAKLPVVKPNVICDLLFLPRTEAGEKEYSTLNYVDSSKQNQYQNVGEQDPKPKPQEEEPKDGK